MKPHRGADASLQNFRAAPLQDLYRTLNMPSDENRRFENALQEYNIRRRLSDDGVRIESELIKFHPASSSPQLDVPGGGVLSNNVEVFLRPHDLQRLISLTLWGRIDSASPFDATPPGREMRKNYTGRSRGSKNRDLLHWRLRSQATRPFWPNFLHDAVGSDSVFNHQRSRFVTVGAAQDRPSL